MARQPSGILVHLINTQGLMQSLFDQLPPFHSKPFYTSLVLSPPEGWGVVKTIQGDYLLCKEGHGHPYPIQFNPPRLSLYGLDRAGNQGEMICKTVFNLPFIEPYLTSETQSLEEFFVYWDDDKDDQYKKWRKFFNELRGVTS